MTTNDAGVEAKLREAMSLHQQGRLVEAEAAYALVLEQRPQNFYALHYLGLLVLHGGQVERGVELLQRAVAVDPKVAPTHLQLGFGLEQLMRFAEAVTSYDRAIALQPNVPEAYYNRGNALMDLDRLADAVASYDKAIALKRDYAEAYNNRGLALVRLRQFDDAIASYDKVIALTPGFADAHYNRANALDWLGRFDEALASFAQAIALEPGSAEAYNNRGNILLRLNRYDEALASYDKAIALNPNLEEVAGARFLAKMRFCDWRDFAADSAHLVASVRSGKISTPPFAFLGVPSSPEDQFRCARDWSSARYPSPATWQGERHDHARIRLAYLSADYRAHPVAHLVAELFETHDRSRFEVVGVSFSSDDGSAIRTRIAAGFDEFHDVAGKTDREIADLLRDRQIDIAIDLMGYTQGMRPGVFALRPAPIQVNYLGYPGTMGTLFIDYIIADKIVVPVEQQPFYAEKIVQLPHCYQANDTKREIAATAPTRREAGLPERGFVFCCFNGTYKITPDIFDVWMRLLKQVDGSVLWLFEETAMASANLRREAVARGVAAERLIFAQRVALPDHLARHRLADLFLDTLPYNAHTTASDALWAGLPIVTCVGSTFPGRVAASLLNAIGLQALVTATRDDYERLAGELATDPEKLAGIRQTLAANRLTRPLFDTALYARHIEAAYTAMVERYKAGLSPDHLVVPA